MRRSILMSTHKLIARAGFAALVLTVGVACASKPVQPVVEAKDPLFLQGEKELRGGENAEAFENFATFLTAHPTSMYTLAAQFNMAIAKEGLGEWQDAIDRYRAVARASRRAAPRLQALSLYRMSYGFEALGDDGALVATLRDAQARGSALPIEVATAEIPARLGAAYARQGQMDEALKQFDAAEQGLIRLRAQSADKVPEWLPQALYDMGRVSHRRPTLESFEMDLQPLEKIQVYLLQAAELEQEPWSKRAADDLKASYIEFDEVLEFRPPAIGHDPLVLERETQQKQWDSAQELLESLQQLQAYRLQGDSPTVQGIFTFVQGLEKKLHQFLSEPKIGAQKLEKVPAVMPANSGESE